mgnify:CR=1 FL=1
MNDFFTSFDSFLNYFFTKDEKLSYLKSLGVLIGFSGIVLLFFDKVIINNENQDSQPKGIFNHHILLYEFLKKKSTMYHILVYTTMPGISNIDGNKEAGKI